jgi:hypothetical protein
MVQVCNRVATSALGMAETHHLEDAAVFRCKLLLSALLDVGYYGRAQPRAALKDACVWL